MTSSIIETMMNIRTTSMSMKTDEKEEKEDRRREKGEIDEMSKMNKCMKTRGRGDFEYNRNDDVY